MLNVSRFVAAYLEETGDNPLVLFGVRGPRYYAQLASAEDPSRPLCGKDGDSQLYATGATPSEALDALDQVCRDEARR